MTLLAGQYSNNHQNRLLTTQEELDDAFNDFDAFIYGYVSAAAQLSHYIHPDTKKDFAELINYRNDYPFSQRIFDIFMQKKTALQKAIQDAQNRMVLAERASDYDTLYKEYHSLDDNSKTCYFGIKLAEYLDNIDCNLKYFFENDYRCNNWELNVDNFESYYTDPTEETNTKLFNWAYRQLRQIKKQLTELDNLNSRIHALEPDIHPTLQYSMQFHLERIYLFVQSYNAPPEDYDIDKDFLIPFEKEWQVIIQKYYQLTHLIENMALSQQVKDSLYNLPALFPLPAESPQEDWNSNAAEKLAKLSLNNKPNKSLEIASLQYCHSALQVLRSKTLTLSVYNENYRHGRLTFENYGCFTRQYAQIHTNWQCGYAHYIAVRSVNNLLLRNDKLEATSDKQLQHTINQLNKILGFQDFNYLLEPDESPEEEEAHFTPLIEKVNKILEERKAGIAWDELAFIQQIRETIAKMDDKIKTQWNADNLESALTASEICLKLKNALKDYLNLAISKQELLSQIPEENTYSETLPILNKHTGFKGLLSWMGIESKTATLDALNKLTASANTMRPNT